MYIHVCMESFVGGSISYRCGPQQLLNRNGERNIHHQLPPYMLIPPLSLSLSLSLLPPPPAFSLSLTDGVGYTHGS